MKKVTPARYMMLYGTVLLITGFIGLISSGSMISFIIGGIFGSLAGLSGYGLRTEEKWAIPLGYAVSGIMAVFFMVRMIQGSPFPALAVAGLSMIAIAMLVQASAKPEIANPNDKDS